MRYTLSTLLMVVLLLASLLACWLRQNPWFAMEVQKENLERIMRGRTKLETIATDNRILKYFPSSYPDEPSLSIELWDGRGNYITSFPYKYCESQAGFADDDTIVVTSSENRAGESSEGVTAIYRRRYPEYWWGCFYRFEVWAAFLSGGMLLAIAVRHWRMKQKEDLEQE